MPRNISRDIGCIRRLIVFRCQLHPTWSCPRHTPLWATALPWTPATPFLRLPPASSQRAHERSARPKLHARKDKIITRCLPVFRRCAFYFYNVTERWAAIWRKSYVNFAAANPRDKRFTPKTEKKHCNLIFSLGILITNFFCKRWILWK